jgi:uncharacterized protein YidB (DUF937 family)
MAIWKIGIGVVAIIALAAATVGFVGAQTDDDGNGRFGNFVGRLADNLGITQDELESAIDQTQNDIVDDLLADGEIDEDQAARIREHIESGDPFFQTFGQRGHKMQRHGVAFIGHGGDIAEFIGIEPEALREAIEGGQSVVQVAEANGVTEAELTAHLLGEIEAKLAEAVESGKIDQAKADEVLANAEDKIAECINREGPREKPEGFGSFEGGRFHGGISRFSGGFHGAIPLDEGADVTEAVSPTF